MPTAQRFVVSGRVQGVFYRASAQQAAQQLGLTGWVRNRPDGRVETQAQGNEQDVATFERWLWHGPERAQVSDVQIDTVAPEAFDDFHIRYD